ncbi:hypothetical protein F4778DRAFT_526334 [Xylariomycetidae sp. FL2044]|nr:hypothetical protein F4778DRAFT_526334 [Xylariomycetidae sp. FL2044]
MNASLPATTGIMIVALTFILTPFRRAYLHFVLSPCLRIPPGLSVCFLCMEYPFLTLFSSPLSEKTLKVPLAFGVLQSGSEDYLQ